MRLPPCFSSPLIGGLALGLCLASPLPAQSPSDRPAIDSVLATLGRVESGRDAAQFHCDAYRPDLALLCRGLVTTRVGVVTSDRKQLIQAREELGRLVADHPDWPYAWYGLGVTRLGAKKVGLLAGEGPLMPLGSTNELGAGSAFLRALELEPAFLPAAEALAKEAPPTPREKAASVSERIDVLRRVSTRLSSSALYSAANLELQVGSADTAAAFLYAALRRGDGTVDSGKVLLTLARALYKSGYPREGRDALIAGAADGNIAATLAYREQIGMVSTPQELLAWDSLAPSRRPAWLADFWARRDVRDGRHDGDRLIEHFHRLEQALAMYKVEPPLSGRHQAANAGGVPYIDASQYGSTPAEGAKFSLFQQVYGRTSVSRTVPMAPQLLDDRGLIFMRHGAPDREATDRTGTLPRALWRYDLSTGPLLLQFTDEDFDGSVEPNTLIPIAFDQGTDNLCFMATWLCARAGGTSRVPAVHVQERSLEYIFRAMTSDEYTHRFTSAVHPLLQIYGLDNVIDGTPRLVVPFAIPGDELQLTTSDGQSMYAVRVSVMAERRSDAKRFDLDTLRQFVVQKPLTKGEYLSGVVELPVDPGTYSASVLFTQLDDRGAIARIDTVGAPLNAGSLAVSDIVFGREGSGVHWSSGARDVSLNPQNAYQSGGSATVYFQLRGMVPGTRYETVFEFFHANDKVSRPARLTLHFNDNAVEQNTEITRSLGLANLISGKYRVKVTVTGGGTTTSTNGWVTVK